MRRTLPLLIAALALLAACAKGLPAPTADQRAQMDNPLFAQAYYSDLVDHFVTMQIRNDPILKDEGIKANVDRAREDALAKAQEASKKVDEGSIGSFAPVKEESQGTALITGTTLYFGTDFYTTPGADLRVYVTDMVDPREGTFPDETAADLGPLTSPYGVQVYTLPADRAATEKAHQTLVLWDEMLQRIHGFAQMRP